MLREVARDVRRIQQQNITAQRSPDGTAWEPRRVTARTKPGRIRRKMFARLKSTKFLKDSANPWRGEISFTQNVQHIARVHNFGLREKLNEQTTIKYEERQSIGLNDKTMQTINDALIKWLSD
jgi:phage virion morphogenesis protein